MRDARLGVVAIGRNEGERLRACLQAVVGRAATVVYVDSGSTDGSTEMARSLGVDVVELDMSIPFTAARARNAGFERLVTLLPEVELVQFVDGDAEIVDGWLEAGARALAENPELAVVCGRLKERHPEASIYNRLCDIEWDGPAGEIEASGGICMVRADAFRAVGGYNPAILAGEEAEMCSRLRAAGFRIERLPVEMALHDMDMHRFSQWWRRTVRTGHAYAEIHARHASSPERPYDREVRSAWFWGAALPCAIALTLPLPPIALGLSLGYSALFLRVARRKIASGLSPRDAALYAASIVIGKLPTALGQATYHVNRLTGRRYAYSKA
ncbi:MAG: glycosyltransferase [Pseudomonadota bacterium]|nr:MAG: glycosyl transferase [Pseudomonadota bacterium]